MSKHVIVSFSGGLDSTFLVYDNLMKGHHVTAIYTTIDNNENKSIVEKYQIQQLNKLFYEDFRGKYEYSLGINISVHPFHKSLTLSQIPVWLISLLFHGLNNIDEVHIGLIMNDDAISFIDDIKKMWKSYSWLHQKHPPLLFPLLKKNKYQIANELPAKYKNLVTYCENPTIKTINDGELIFEKCGECHSCTRYAYDTKYWGFQYGYELTEQEEMIEDGK